MDGVDGVESAKDPLEGINYRCRSNYGSGGSGGSSATAPARASLAGLGAAFGDTTAGRLVQHGRLVHLELHLLLDVLLVRVRVLLVRVRMLLVRMRKRMRMRVWMWMWMWMRMWMRMRMRMRMLVENLHSRKRKKRDVTRFLFATVQLLLPSPVAVRTLPAEVVDAPGSKQPASSASACGAVGSVAPPSKSIAHQSNHNINHNSIRFVSFRPNQ